MRAGNENRTILSDTTHFTVETLATTSRKAILILYIGIGDRMDRPMSNEQCLGSLESLGRLGDSRIIERLQGVRFTKVDCLFFAMTNL